MDNPTLEREILCEVIAIHRTEELEKTKGRKIINRIRIPAEMFQENENGFEAGEEDEAKLRKITERELSKIAGEVNPEKIEYYLHKFLENTEKSETGVMFRNTATLYRFPIFIQSRQQ